MKRVVFFLTACLLTLTCSVSAFAWGITGHRVVGQIAESYLTPKAKIEVERILGNESLAIASNWADFIKSDPAYAYLNSWHYINLKAGLSYDEMKEYLLHDSTADAYTAIIKLKAQLLQRAHMDPADRRMALRLLIHIIEDVHQPMHVSHAEDLGGNKISVMWFGKLSNLHSVWDDKIIDDEKLSYTEYAAAINHPTASEIKIWSGAPISQWLYESYQIAETLYSEIKEPDQKLSYRYSYDHISILNQQLLKGGVRLAAFLNSLFA